MSLLRIISTIERRLQLPVVLCVACMATMWSCSNDTCVDNGNSLPLAAFYHDKSQVTVNNLTVWGIGAPGDTLMADNESLSQVYMPLRATAEQTKYAINYGGAYNDTITFNYKAVPFFHSVECGAMYNFEIESLSHTTNGIDSVIMDEKVITNADKVNIRIYIKQ